MLPLYERKFTMYLHLLSIFFILSGMSSWKPDSWKEYSAKQQPSYENKDALDNILSTLKVLPPLVAIGEIEKLKQDLALAQKGKKFVLQAGDCAEQFKDCNEETILNKFKIVLQMGLAMSWGMQKPVVKIGRIAGQYSKPRSSDFEEIDGIKLPSYRGDSVNDLEFSPKSRTNDPERMLKSYFYSSATLNYIRSLINGGFANLHTPQQWEMEKFEKGEHYSDYKNIIDSITKSINFIKSLGGIKNEILSYTDFFASHEGLLLDYEEALTKKDPVSGKYYNSGAHMLWIGERTRDRDSAHIEYFRGISNPIGIKVSSAADPEEIVEIAGKLNPQNEYGKVVVITRMSSKLVEKKLPPLIHAIKKAQRSVLFCCDPMHGNTRSTSKKLKTRDFAEIISELEQTFKIHKMENSLLSGVHFELTGDNVTECTGGPQNLSDGDLHLNYTTSCDPRLNYYQSLEMAFKISSLS